MIPGCEGDTPAVTAGRRRQVEAATARQPGTVEELRFPVRVGKRLAEPPRLLAMSDPPAINPFVNEDGGGYYDGEGDYVPGPDDFAGEPDLPVGWGQPLDPACDEDPCRILNVLAGLDRGSIRTESSGKPLKGAARGLARERYDG
jgi:hypothetical protein